MKSGVKKEKKRHPVDLEMSGCALWWMCGVLEKNITANFYYFYFPHLPRSPSAKKLKKGLRQWRGGVGGGGGGLRFIRALGRPGDRWDLTSSATDVGPRVTAREASAAGSRADLLNLEDIRSGVGGWRGAILASGTAIRDWPEGGWEWRWVGFFFSPSQAPRKGRRGGKKAAPEGKNGSGENSDKWHDVGESRGSWGEKRWRWRAGGGERGASMSARSKGGGGGGWALAAAPPGIRSN